MTKGLDEERERSLGLVYGVSGPGNYLFEKAVDLYRIKSYRFI